MTVLTVVIPTINESKTLSSLITQIRQNLDSPTIIVVDDASTDGTPDIAEERGAILLRRPFKMGIVSAFTDALKIVNTPYVVLMDADFQHPPALLPIMLKSCQEAPNTLVIGSRYGPNGTVNASFKRTVISVGAITLCHIFIPRTRRVKDITSGYLMMPVNIARTTNFKDPKGWKLGPYILKYHPYCRVVEVGYDYHEREGKGSKLEMRTILHYFVSLYNLR